MAHTTEQRREWYRKWLEKNPTKKAEYAARRREYVRKNKKKVYASNERWRKLNKERVSTYQKGRIQKRPARILLCSECGSSFSVRGRGVTLGWTIRKIGRKPISHTCPECSSRLWDGPPLKEELHPKIAKLSDWLGVTCDPFGDAIRPEVPLSEVLAKLTAKERWVLTFRFGLEGPRVCTLDEIGYGLRLSRERVRQIEAKGLRKIRWHLQRAE